MKAPTSPSSDGHPRKRFALSGRSVALDPRTNAIRSDIADVRLSDLVFAPHYVAPVTRTLASSAVLHLSAAADSEVMGALPAGATFEVFDLSGGKAWGIATGLGLVGYIDASTLGGKESA